MKRPKNILLLGFLFFSLLFTSSFAQKLSRLNGNVLLSLQGGMTMAKTDYDGLGTSFAIKPSLTYFFNTKSPHNIGLRVFGTFGYISGSDDNMPITEFVTTIKNFGGGIVYSYHASDAVAPYLFLGVSSLAFDPKFRDGESLPHNAAGDYEKSVMNYNVDVGLRVFLSDIVSLDFSFGANINQNDRLDDVEANGDNDMFFNGMLGITFALFSQKDSDGDGVPDADDKCPRTPSGLSVTDDGCPTDSDGDGVPDYLDQCKNTPVGTRVDRKGCPYDSDYDGVPDMEDQCDKTPRGVLVDEYGCPRDSDGDGIPDYEDQCPDTPEGTVVDDFGCPINTKIVTPPVEERQEISKSTDEYDYVNERHVEGNIFTDGNQFCVQQSAWRTEKKANSQANGLKQLGFNAFVVKKYFPKTQKTWYRVRIGYFDTLQEARKVQSQIK